MFESSSIEMSQLLLFKICANVSGRWVTTSDFHGLHSCIRLFDGLS